MKEKFYQRKGFLPTLFTTVLIIAVAVITDHYKTLFVHETGNIKIFGGLGILLAFGLLLRWKYVRQILGVFALIATTGITFHIFNVDKEFILSTFILLGGLILISYFLIVSESIKSYIGGK